MGRLGSATFCALRLTVATDGGDMPFPGDGLKRHAYDVLRSLERDVFPDLGAIPIKDITAANVLAVLRKDERSGQPSKPRGVFNSGSLQCSSTRLRPADLRATRRPRHQWSRAVSPLSPTSK
jgi:hypothetical protein